MIRWCDSRRVSEGRGASLESLVCALEHEDGVGDLEGGSQLDAHDLHDVSLSQQQEGLPVNHLVTHTQRYRYYYHCDFYSYYYHHYHHSNNTLYNTTTTNKKKNVYGTI